MLQEAGASEVVAIEANTLCYLKCLLVQQLFDLDRVEFQLGNFVPWLDGPPRRRSTLVVAAGVLYHLVDPVPVLDNICRVDARRSTSGPTMSTSRLMPPTDRRYKRWFVGVEEQEYRGKHYPLHRRVYKKDPTSDPKFIGGAHTSTAWIEKQTMLDVFHANGFEVEVGHETAHQRSGPCASFFARKRG